MRRLLASALAGLLFGLGLTVSKMIDPAKVLGFLDIIGNWDPSLGFVMLGAIPVAAIGFWVGRARRAPLLDTGFHQPRLTRPDLPLVAGSLIFGAGWGLVGYCPGPALASLTLGHPETWIFVAAMLAGMAGHRLGTRLIAGRARRTATEHS
jgi:uncharacterized membrane protein YedE/YeeE